MWSVRAVPARLHSVVEAPVTGAGMSCSQPVGGGEAASRAPPSAEGRVQQVTCDGGANRCTDVMKTLS